MGDLSPETAACASGEPGVPLPACPECGAVLLHTNGCVVCGRCGYSPCE